MFAVLGVLVVLFVLTAGVIMPLLTPTKLSEAGLDALTVGLSRVLFPIVLILGLNGLVVGILQAYDHFSIPALSALVWNVVIMGVMVGTPPALPRRRPALRVRDRRPGRHRRSSSAWPSRSCGRWASGGTGRR